jgi:multidrug efflux pump subunit AcrA (membrane-fusion protein)
MMNKKTIVLACVIALVLALAGIIIYRIIAKTQASAKPAYQHEISVGTVKLAKQKLDRTLNFRGIIEGDPQVKVYPSAGGKLLSNNVQEGAFVKVDQAIVSIDRDIVGQDFQPAIVRSPISGMVTKLYFLDRGDPVTMDKPVAEVANTASIKVVLNVGEEDLASVKAGMETAISPVYDPKTIVNGSVFSVTPFVDSDTLSGNIVIKASNKEGNLKVGISVNVTIKIGSSDAYIVPASAIFMEYDNSYIFLNDNLKAKRIPVTQGYSSGSMVQIMGDLTDGMEVVTEGSFKLTDGIKIAIASPETDKPKTGTDDTSGSGNLKDKQKQGANDTSGSGNLKDKQKQGSGNQTDKKKTYTNKSEKSANN